MAQATVDFFAFDPDQAAADDAVLNCDYAFVAYKETDSSEAARYARAVAFYRIPDMAKAIPLIDGLIADYPDDAYYREMKGQMLFENGRVQDAAFFLMQNAMKNPDEAGAAATDLLRLMALTAMTYMWNRIAIAAHKGLAAGNDNAFYEAKLATARFYIARVLPQSTALNHQIKAGAATLMAIPAEAF